MLRSGSNLYGVSMRTPTYLFAIISTVVLGAWVVAYLDPRVLGKVQPWAMLTLAGWGGIASLWFP